MASTRKIVAALAGSLTVLAASAVPGLAADGVSNATLTVTGAGSISVSVPGSSTAVSLGSRAYSSDTAAVDWSTFATQTVAADAVTALGTLSDYSGQLGTVTVTDGRTGVTPSWSSTVSWTDFKLTTSATAATEVFAAGQMRYLSGAETSSTASTAGAFVPTLGLVASGGAGPSFTGAGLTGSTVTWNPTIGVDFQGEVAGTYSGTITHSVTAS